MIKSAFKFINDVVNKFKLYRYRQNHYLTKDFLNPKIGTSGRYTYGEPFVPTYKTDDSKIEIGSFCSIAQDVTFLLGGNHPLSFVSSFPFEKESTAFPDNPMNTYKHSKGSIIIGNDVWLGRNVIIMSGVTIGDGAVVAAGSLVSKNVPPYSIVGGNPARIVKKRFSDHEIMALMKIKWWEWSDEKINKNLHLISSSSVEGFIESQLGVNWKDKN